MPSVASTVRMITPPQKKAIFAAGRAHGFDHEELRRLGDCKHISDLTCAQASSLLDRLNQGRDPALARPTKRRRRRPSNVIALATPEQRALIERNNVLLMRLFNWSEASLRAFFEARHFKARHVKDRRPMTDVRTTRDGIAVIQLQQGVIIRRRRAMQKQREVVNA